MTEPGIKENNMEAGKIIFGNETFGEMLAS